MRRVITVGCLAVSLCLTVAAQSSGGKDAMNVLEQIPYSDSGMGRRKLVDEKHLLMMQAALKPGQEVPRHEANSNVHLLVLDGEVVVDLNGREVPAKKGDLVPVAFKTPMSIRNRAATNATFLIIKTPNPSQME